MDYDEIGRAVETRLSREVKRTTLGSTLALAPIPEGGRGTGKGGGAGSGSAPRAVHPEKAELIGFIGECAVYHWLREQFAEQNIDDAWVSRYRSRLLPGDGRDYLGYDFEIRHRRQTWYLEVKAHLGDPCQFELGETEVRFARDCAKTPGRQYRIIYVSHVEDSSRMQIEILANPLGDAGQEHFRLVGQGLRYRFQPSR